MTTRTVAPSQLSSGMEVIALNGQPVAPFYVGTVRPVAAAPWVRRRWAVYRQDVFAQTPEAVLSAGDRVTVRTVA